MNNLHSLRQTSRDSLAMQLCRLSLLVAMTMTGCRAFQFGPKPTIEQLYNRAVESSARHPENSFLPHEVGFEKEPGTEQLPATASHATTEASVPVSAEFIETDIREAIQEIANAAEVEVVIDDRVRGTANVSLADVPFERALERVLMPQGLVYSRRDGRYYVGSADPDSSLFLYLADHIEFQPQHSLPLDLMPALPDRLKRYARVLEKTRTIAIDAPQPYANAVLARLQEADRPVSQVVLEAIVCVVSPNKSFRFGFDWNQAYKVDGTDEFSVGVSSLAISSKISPEGLRNAFDNFAVTSAFVKLLAEHGYLAIRASPRVMAKDGEKANISINRETFFSTQPLTTGSDASSSAIFFSQNIQKVDSGISLEITPTIRGDMVTVNIEKAEVSEDVRTALADTNGNPYPVINRRSVSTTVHVRDGNTIVIGGLMQHQAVNREQFIPGLARIPLVGKLFQSLQHQDQEVEVVIFISPKIVREQAECPAVELSSHVKPHVNR